MHERSTIEPSRTSAAPNSNGAVDDFDRVAATMNAHLHDLSKAHVLAARPGYVLGADGYPSRTPAIVVTVATGFERASASLPASLGGIPIDVRVATEAQELQIRHPKRFAELAPTRATSTSPQLRVNR